MKVIRLVKIVLKWQT